MFKFYFPLNPWLKFEVPSWQFHNARSHIRVHKNKGNRTSKKADDKTNHPHIATGNHPFTPNLLSFAHSHWLVNLLNGLWRRPLWDVIVRRFQRDCGHWYGSQIWCTSILFCLSSARVHHRACLKHTHYRPDIGIRPISCSQNHQKNSY